jgi:hypothetical protein
LGVKVTPTYGLCYVLSDPNLMIERKLVLWPEMNQAMALLGRSRLRRLGDGELLPEVNSDVVPES